LTNIFSIPLSTGQMCGGNARFTVTAVNVLGNNHAVITASIWFRAKNEGGTISASVTSDSDAYNNVITTGTITFTTAYGNSTSTAFILSATCTLNDFNSANTATILLYSNTDVFTGQTVTYL
jgi:hypothetical protein